MNTNSVICTHTNVLLLLSAIYIAEGGSNARVPYGILSVPVENITEARQVCKNTIENNITRWHNAGQTNICYIDFLADRYCPPKADKQGNINWKKNVHELYKRSDEEWRRARNFSVHE